MVVKVNDIQVLPRWVACHLGHNSVRITTSRQSNFLGDSCALDSKGFQDDCLHTFCLLGGDLASACTVIISGATLGHFDLDDNGVKAITRLLDLFSQVQGEHAQLLVGLFTTTPHGRVVHSNYLPILIAIIECLNHFECRLSG